MNGHQFNKNDIGLIRPVTGWPHNMLPSNSAYKAILVYYLVDPVLGLQSITVLVKLKNLNQSLNN